MTPYDDPNKQYAYFWDYGKELYLQAILDQTIWLNTKQVNGCIKLGSYIEIVKIYPDKIDIKIKGKLIQLKVGEKVKTGF